MSNFNKTSRRGRYNQSAPKPKPVPKVTVPPLEKPLDGAFGTLIPAVQQAIAVEGYTTPSPIQEQCIPYLLQGRDVLGTAQTGTGKTAAFALPLLQRLSRHNRRPKRGTPRALILAPTRELAAQIGDSIATYGRFLNLKHFVIYGGVKQYSQVKALNRGVDILVATPGRLLDLMNQGFIYLDEIEVFILDEVDRMLDMGFIHDINKILEEVPDNRQTLFFSATMPPKMEVLAKTLVSDPVRITIAPDKPTLDAIDQLVLFVDKGNKNDLLVSLLKEPEVKKAIVFTQMKHTANKLSKKLQDAGIKAVAIHGNKSQAMRTRALADFKKGRYQVLVATDVAARGLDVDDITHVFNFDLPVESETYVHRIGRTARAGASGNAVSFCTAEDRYYLRGIEKILGKQIPTNPKHEYHSEAASKSLKPAPKNFGRRSQESSGGGGGSWKSSSGGSRRRNGGRRGGSSSRGGRSSGGRSGGNRSSGNRSGGSHSGGNRSGGSSGSGDRS